MNQMKSSLDLLKLLTPVVLAILNGLIIAIATDSRSNRDPNLESPCTLR